MERLSSALCAILVLASVAACRPASPVLSENDVIDIKAVIDRWATDFSTNNRDDLANIITSDMVLMPPNADAVAGHEAVMAYIKAYPPVTKLTATIDEVVGHADLAYVRGTYAIDFTAPDGSAAHDNGTYLEIHRKQSDGSWPYSRLSWHSSEPPPEPATAPTTN